MNTWHAVPMGDVLHRLETDPRLGLTREAAATRLKKQGENRLRGAPERTMAQRLLSQVRDPMIVVLLSAAAVSFFTGGDRIDAGIILLIVILNACISVSQEQSAQKALNALKDLSPPKAKVVREGKVHPVDAAALVPGDLIQVEAGDLVPADARLLSAAGLKTDESALTGESVPAAKGAADFLEEATPLGDRRNLLFASTVVTAGRGSAVVVSTGMDTEVGRIAALLLEQDSGATPLQRKMAEISKVLSFLCLAICAVLFGIGLIQGRNWMEMLLTAVSLAVAAIPEGLPAIVTIVLAMGVQRMARRRAIVKHLPAVETLGCASVICSDKTGTLTENRMTVQRTWSPGGGQEQLLTLATLCTDAEADPPSGDPTELAIVRAAEAQGIHKRGLSSRFPRLGELPFDPERKRMSTFHPLPGGRCRIVVKGAPDLLLDCCTGVLRGSPAPLTLENRCRIQREVDVMSASALRVLGVAYRDVEEVPRVRSPDTAEHNLVFVGLIGMKDPPRPEAKDAVALCRSAGIRPIMITGDHKNTAVAIAEELGIWQEGDLALTGPELSFLPPELLREEVLRCPVYARVSPEHKLRIVKALQENGQIVAMTGDGANDAPALKAADIGCAMGRGGTDVARGAADMILTDDNFSTIVSAVEEGRGIYANIRKSIHYLLSCNLGEIFTIFFATVLDFRQMPLLPVQLLWLNLVTDSLPALALGMEPVEPDGMKKPPRRAGEALFTPEFARELGWQGILVGLAALTAFGVGHRLLPGADAAASANTMAFATLTFCQLLHAYDVRSDERTVWKLGLLSNHAMNRAFLVSMALQLGVMLLPPLRAVFSLTALTAGQWLCVAGLSLLPVCCCEFAKGSMIVQQYHGKHRVDRKNCSQFSP